MKKHLTAKLEMKWKSLFFFSQTNDNVKLVNLLEVLGWGVMINLLLKIQGLELIGRQFRHHQVAVGKHKDDFSGSACEVIRNC